MITHDIARDYVRRFLGVAPHPEATADELLGDGGYAVVDGVMIPFETAERLGLVTRR